MDFLDAMDKMDLVDRVHVPPLYERPSPFSSSFAAIPEVH
jgi:hypothetical protein